MHGIIALNNVGAGFTPAQTPDLNPAQYPALNTAAQYDKGQPQGLPPQNIMGDYKRAGASPAPKIIATVGEIVGAYKSLVANECLKIYKSKNEIMRKLWQRNYHEHIIRNEQSYQNISDYIINNPAKWNDDKNFVL